MNATVHNWRIRLFVILLVSLLATACSRPKISEDTSNVYAIKKGRFYGFIDRLGNPVISAQFAYALDFSEGLAAVNVGGNASGRDMPTDGKWGFIGTNGKFVINPVYYSPPNGGMPYDAQDLAPVMHDGYRFIDGLAAVRLEKRWVYINPDNQIVIDFVLRKAGSEIDSLNILSARTFSEGLAAVFVDGFWGYINKKGELVIEAKYLFPVDFSCGYALVSEDNGKVVCIDKKGYQVFSQYRIETNFHNDVASIREGFEGSKTFFSDRYRIGLMNTTGHILVDAQFDQGGYFGSGMCPVRIGSNKSGQPIYADQANTQDFQGGKWGFVDSVGFIRINPVYDEAKGFRSHIAAVKVGRNWGYINNRGQYVFKPQFKFAGYFDGPVTVVKLKSEGQDRYRNRLAYINLEGDVIWIEP